MATKDEGARTSMTPHHICTILQRQSLIEQQKRNKGIREQWKIVMVIVPPLLFQWLDFYTVKAHYAVKRIVASRTTKYENYLQTVGFCFNQSHTCICASARVTHSQPVSVMPSICTLTYRNGEV